MRQTAQNNRAGHTLHIKVPSALGEGFILMAHQDVVTDFRQNTPLW